MRALSYLEFCGLKESEMFETIKAVIPIENTLFRKCNKDWDELYRKISYQDNCEAYLYDIYRNHVSQPFTPELITKYFKGWEKQSETTYYQDDEFGVISINIGENQAYLDYCKKRITFNLRWTFIFFPRTLDDFITDCQRTGIELEWLP